jgi:hypothetical protein
MPSRLSGRSVRALERVTGRRIEVAIVQPEWRGIAKVLFADGERPRIAVVSRSTGAVVEALDG